MDLRKVRTAKELVLEMDRISEASRLMSDAICLISDAIRLSDGFGSITVILRRCEDGQEHIELSLERAEIGEAGAAKQTGNVVAPEIANHVDVGRELGATSAGPAR